MASEEKKISRLVELTLGFKNQGPDAAAMFAAMNKEIENFKRLNPASTYAQTANHIANYSRQLLVLNKGLVDSIKNQEKSSASAAKWADSLSKVQQQCSSLLAPLKGISALVGGEAIGFGAGIKWVIGYNKQMLSLTAQMSKYGAGLGQVETYMGRVGKATGLTLKETADLYSLYEKGFPYNSLENGAKLFDNIKRSVGGNAEAMKEMIGMLQGMIDKFPELEDAITNVNEGGNRKMLETQSRLAYMTGQLSLAEHKRFQDYIKGGKQATSADETRRKQMQDEIDAVNHLRQTFEQVAKQIGQTLLPFVKSMADAIGTIYPKIEPWIPALTRAALAFTAILGTVKAIAGVVNTIKLFKDIKDLTGGTFGGMGKGMGGGGGGWGNPFKGWSGFRNNTGKSLQTAVRSPKFWGGAAIGAGIGNEAGNLYDDAWQGATGKELNKSRGAGAVAGQAGKAGTMMLAGAVVGGLPGAIGAGAVYDVKGIIQIYKTSAEIKAVWSDISASNHKIADKWKDIIGIANEKKKAAEASGDERHIGRENKNVKVQELRGQAEQLESEGKLAQAKKLRAQANQYQRENTTDETNERGEKAKGVLAKYKLDIDDSQLDKLKNILDNAAMGSADLSQYGVSKYGQSNQASLMDKGGAEYEKMILKVAQSISGKKAGSAVNETGPLEPGDNSAAIGSASSEIQSLIGNNDLAGAVKKQQSMMDILDGTSTDNAISTTQGPVKDTMRGLGVNTDKISSSSSFKMGDEIWGQLDSASKKAQDEMEAIQHKAGGNPLSDQDQKRMDLLKATNDTINTQLAEREKIQDKFGPQLQLIDAAYNEHSKSVEATNALLQSQKQLLSGMVSNAQVTGSFDFEKIKEQSGKALDSLKSYNDGLRAQVAMETEVLEIDKKQMDAEYQKNKSAIDHLRSPTDANGKSKNDDQIKNDKEAADALDFQNKKLDVRRQRNVLEQQAQAKINQQLEQTSTLQKQIVEVLQQQLDANKANVDYASANVSKSEALIDIYDNMGAGLKASAEMRMQAANQVGKQIDEERKNLDMINSTIQEGVPKMADAVRDDKDYKGDRTQEGIMAEAKKRLIALDTTRVQKETTILGLVSKQAQMTKALRDGYVSAIMAMTAGSGAFNKILITQEKGMGLGVKYMNVLQSKTSGGIGGGKTTAGQFTTTGLNYGSQNQGYKTWDGLDSNDNSVENMQKNALQFTQQHIANQKSGNAGAMNAPNNAGVVLQQATQGNNVLPAAGPGVNNGGLITNITPATPVPGVTNGAVGSGAATSGKKAKVLPSSQPTSSTNSPTQTATQSPVTFNFGNIMVNYSELAKMLAATKAQIDTAIDKVAKQMAGGGSTLPRSTS